MVESRLRRQTNRKESRYIQPTEQTVTGRPGARPTERRVRQRQVDRQTDGKKQTDIWKETYRQIDRRVKQRQTDTAGRQADRQAGRQADRQAGRDRHRKAGRQTDRQTLRSLQLDVIPEITAQSVADTGRLFDGFKVTVKVTEGYLCVLRSDKFIASGIRKYGRRNCGKQPSEELLGEKHASARQTGERRSMMADSERRRVATLETTR